MIFHTTELLGLSMKNLTSCSRYIQYSLHAYLSLNSNLKVVKVFNATELLRYEKAHSLRSLVSAARV